jgi:hypothetical protein
MLKKFLILVLITTIHSALLAQTTTPSSTQNTTTERKQYTCVMHPEVVQDHPGKCPKCGMELVAVSKEEKRPTPNAQRPTPNAQMPHPMHHHDGHAAEGHTMHHGHEGHAMYEMKMQSSVNLTDPMTREGSGTKLWTEKTYP